MEDNFMKSKVQGPKGRVRLQAFKDGALVADTGFKNNLITNVGKAALAGLAGNTGSISPFIYLAVGTSATAPAVTDTALGAEVSTSGLARASATVSRVTTTNTNDTLQLTFTWSVTGTVTVQEAGVFNAASGPILLGHALTGSLALLNGYQLVGTYQVQFT